MANITFTDKNKNGSAPATQWRDVDANEVKTVVNGKLGYQEVATRSVIGSSTEKRLIIVLADETNNGDMSLYIHTGSILKFLMTIS